MPGDVICQESIRIPDTGASLDAHSVDLLVIQGLRPVVQVTYSLRHRSSAMAIDAGIEHPPIVDLSNYEERKEEITAQLMHAATTSGMYHTSLADCASTDAAAANALRVSKVNLGRTDWLALDGAHRLHSQTNPLTKKRWQSLSPSRLQ